MDIWLLILIIIVIILLIILFIWWSRGEPVSKTNNFGKASDAVNDMIKLALELSSLVAERDILMAEATVEKNCSTFLVNKIEELNTTISELATKIKDKPELKEELKTALDNQTKAFLTYSTAFKLNPNGNTSLKEQLSNATDQLGKAWEKLGISSDDLVSAEEYVTLIESFIKGLCNTAIFIRGEYNKKHLKFANAVVGGILRSNITTNPTIYM